MGFFLFSSFYLSLIIDKKHPGPSCVGNHSSQILPTNESFLLLNDQSHISLSAVF